MRSLFRFAIIILPFTALAEQPLTRPLPVSVIQSGTATVGASSSQINFELDRILHVIGGDDLHAFFGFVPEVRVTDGEMPNAFAKAPNQVEISVGLLQMTQSAHELAFVLAHELAHHMLEHSVAYPAFADAPNQLPTAMTHWEFAADTLAIKLIVDGGFDPHPAPILLDRLAHHYQQLLPASATSRHLRARSVRLQSVLNSPMK